MTNPLIEKYNELYGKKEEPKQEPEEDKEISVVPTGIPFAYDPTTPITSVTATTNPYSVTPASHPKLTSYDTYGGEKAFLEVAEKIQNKVAKVTSVTINSDRVGLFSSGLTTITFEVNVYDSY